MRSRECPVLLSGRLCSPPKAGQGAGCPLRARGGWPGGQGRWPAPGRLLGPCSVGQRQGREAWGAEVPPRVSNVQQGELAELLGSIHTFPSKEFFPEHFVSLGFFHAFFFYPLSSPFSSWGGLRFLPCPAPCSMPPPRSPGARERSRCTGCSLPPSRLVPAQPCCGGGPEALGKPALAMALGSAECLSQRQAASTPGPCWDPLPHSTCAE